MSKAGLLIAAFLTAAFAGVAFAQDFRICKKEDAIEAARADEATAALCGASTASRGGCDFKAGSPSALELTLNNESDVSWIVTASAHGDSVSTKIDRACKVMKEAGECTQEKAIEVIRSARDVASFCKNTIAGQRHGCEFKARKSSPLPEEENNPSPIWFVTASTPELVILGRVSTSCQPIIRRPYYLKPIEIGTLELGVLESSDIVIGKVVDVQSPEPIYYAHGTKIQTESVTVEVSRVLKGTQSPKITFYQAFVIPKYSAKTLWLNNGREMLFFISRGRLAGMPDDYTCQGIANNTVGSDAEKNMAFLACTGEVITGNKAPDTGKPVLFGSWPNAIDMATEKNDVGRAFTYPIFSKKGDILKTKEEILGAVRAELVNEASKPPSVAVLRESFNNGIELGVDKYPSAYAAGIQKDAIVSLDVPKE